MPNVFRYDGNYAGRCEQNSRTHEFRESQHVDRAHHAGLDRLHRIVLVMHRRRGTGEMENAIDLEQNRLDSIVTNEFEIAMSGQMRDIGALAAEKGVEADDLPAVPQEPR